MSHKDDFDKVLQKLNACIVEVQTLREAIEEAQVENNVSLRFVPKPDRRAAERRSLTDRRQKDRRASDADSTRSGN